MAGGSERTALPPLVLAIHDSGSRRTLVVSRDAARRIRTETDAWPRPVPEGALFLYWPTWFPWSGEMRAFAERIERRGGTHFPMTTVLGRLGLRTPRGVEGLLSALAPEVDSVVDPHHLGTRLMEGLAQKLESLESAEPEPMEPADFASGGEHEPAYRPRPEVLEVLPLVPTAPGVYSFHAADGSALYIGKARSLADRIRSHFGASQEVEKSRELAGRSRRLSWTETGSELEACLREYVRIAKERPPLNRQENVHARPRGALRDACLLLVLPSVVEGHAEVCLVSGDGRFHWERARRRPMLSHGLWARVRGFLGGTLNGWAPGRPEVEIGVSEARALSEITLSWLADERNRNRVMQIDLNRESGGRPLMRAIRGLLAEDPSGDRVEVVASDRPGGSGDRLP